MCARSKFFVVLTLASCLFVSTCLDSPGQVAAGELIVQTDFPGGSAQVISIDQQRRVVRLNPTTHEGRGWVCWWYFKLTGIEPGETITIDVGNAPWATPDRAAFSTDNQSWSQTPPGTRKGKRIAFRETVHASEAWFAWGPPFVPSQAKQLVEWAADQCSEATAFELCRTRADRPVPALRIQPVIQDDKKPLGIWIQARQHAWESGSSWVCRGLIHWLVSDDPRAIWLRKNAHITVIPIMDIDNVAIGAGGKNQTPHDHNRDWSDQPHWRSVAAAINQIEQMNAAKQFDLFIDLHNPGANSRNPFFFITPRKLLPDVRQSNLDRFLTVCKLEMTGPLAFKGETHESGAQYDKRWKYISKNWVSFNTAEHVVSVTLETAWNTKNSTTDGYQTVGRQLGQAIARYFRTNVPQAE